MSLENDNNNLSGESKNMDLSNGIDCTNMFVTQHKLMNTIGESIQEQRRDINNLVAALGGLTQALSSIPVNRVQTPNENVPSVTGSNVSKETPPDGIHENASSSRASSGSNVPKGTQPALAMDNDKISVNASNAWIEPEPTPVLDEEQEYWQDTVNEYTQQEEYGPEISSPIATASKTFWQKPLTEEKSANKLKNNLTPENCKYLVPKRVNKEVWGNVTSSQRTNDMKLQKVQKIAAASLTSMLKVASTLSQHLQKENDKNLDIKGLLTYLKDSMALAGMANQQINQMRRDLIKPTLPPVFRKLADSVDESAEFLFGDSLTQSMDILEKESKVKNLLKEKSYKQNPNKRSFSESNCSQTSNYRSSSKSLKRTYNQTGQNYRKDSHKQYRTQQRPYNNNNKYKK